MKMLLYIPTETPINDYATAAYIILVLSSVIWALFPAFKTEDSGYGSETNGG